MTDHSDKRCRSTLPKCAYCDGNFAIYLMARRLSLPYLMSIMSSCVGNNRDRRGPVIQSLFSDAAYSDPRHAQDVFRG